MPWTVHGPADVSVAIAVPVSMSVPLDVTVAAAAAVSVIVGDIIVIEAGESVMLLAPHRSVIDCIAV